MDRQSYGRITHDSVNSDSQNISLVVLDYPYLAPFYDSNTSTKRTPESSIKFKPNINRCHNYSNFSIEKDEGNISH